MAVPSELAVQLARLGLADHLALLEPFADVELSLVPEQAGDLVVGGSRIGGPPDLPPALAWPSRRWPLAELAGWPDYARAEVDVSRGLGQAWVDGDELVMPLPFLLQLDLDAIADPRLPDRGLLAVFASVTSDVPDPQFAKRVATAVIWVADRSTLVRRPHPPTFDEPPRTAVALRAAPAIHWCLPYEELPRLQAALPREGFDALVTATRREVHALFPAPTEECIGPMPPFGEIALLRVHDDPGAGFHVGDASWITFSISELDLRARRFEATRASVFIG